MKNGSYEVIEDTIIASGIGVSLADVQNVLSIILLCFNLLWIVFKIIMKIKNYYKDGVIDKEELDDLQHDVDSLNKDRK